MARESKEPKELEIDNQKSNNQLTVICCSNDDDFDSLINPLLTRLADHENTTMNEFKKFREHLQAEHLPKIQTLNVHISQILAGWITSCSQKRKYRHDELRRCVVEFQRKGERDMWQQRIDDMKNSLVREQEDDIREIEDQIKNYKSDHGQLEALLNRSSQSHVFGGVLMDYSTDQWDSARRQLGQILLKRNNQHDQKDILKRFNEAYEKHLRHFYGIILNEFTEPDCSLITSTKEHVTLIRRGHQLIFQLRNEMKQFNTEVDIEVNKFKKKKEAEKQFQSKNSKSNIGWLIDSISIFVDRVASKPSKKSHETITEVVLKDNSRKFQGIERLRQRKRGILSNISNKN
mmetsp:Transcript_42918/g.55133  ORF Transcript_42918/g.55133 Transcript_42918/m.55133 type:complete len:347 (+) Transcript_42918:938-1978(+)